MQYYTLFYIIPLICTIIGIYIILKAQKGVVSFGIIFVSILNQALILLICALFYSFRSNLWQFYLIGIISFILCIFFWKNNKKLTLIYLLSFFISIGFIIPSLTNPNNISCQEIQNINKEFVWFNEYFKLPSDILEVQKTTCTGGHYYGGGFEGSSAFIIKYLKIKIEAKNWPNWEDKLLAIEKTIVSPKAYGNAEKIWYKKTDAFEHFYLKDNDNTALNVLTVSSDHQFIYYYSCTPNTYEPLACKKINEL